jgi:ABC-type branched-subunit amino acid transport system substrate-binding protein
MGNVERYEQILIAAIEIQQLRNEIKDRLSALSTLLTTRELKHRAFEKEDAKKAFCILLNNNDFVVGPESHVQSSLKYKGVRLYLHCHPDKLDGNAMAKVLDAIKSNDVFEAL